MKHGIKLVEHFGTRLSNGEDAYKFRVDSIDRYISMCDHVTLNFTGIRSANSSFVNALVSGLFEKHGEELIGKLSFSGCLPNVKILLEAAISLGLNKHAAQRV